ncbi:hypothetical protein LQF12_12755 [Ruania suaedae]|uniref:HAAS signaling domain-containing protein n=1 Tax=Ruania suaedae TaxID=2897774 RepID=UPI001E336BB7|nr:hypothetical protein [Ruania suaedae]UFU02362.1 hypothetical protein LQF12_12755 [Ruania suaedae]
MTEATQRLARYQDDLARLLAALEPVERAGVLDGVREHIDAALAEVPGEPGEADANRILSELGSPGQVAEAALAERHAAVSSGPGTDTLDRWREQFGGRWVPPTVTTGLLIIGLFSFTPIAWLPLLAVLAALVLSNLWTALEKVLGATIVPFGLALTMLYFITGRDRLLVGPGLGIVAIAVLLVLVIRGSRRAAQLQRGRS